jgi:hypothetical protein
MTPTDLLGVLIRAAGLGNIMLAMYDIYYVIVKLFGLPTGSTLPMSVSIQAGIFFAALGIGIILCAPTIEKLTYWTDGHERWRH